MKVSLLYTTARPWLIESVADRWLGEDVEMIVVTDHEVGTDMRCTHFVNDGPKNCVAGWNLAAARSTGDILVQVSDDTIPPEDWYQRVTRFMAGRPDAVLNLLDEDQATNKCHHPVISRSAYSKVGFLYPSAFQSLWCDNWFHEYHSRFSEYYQSGEVFWKGTKSGSIQDSVASAHCNGSRDSFGQAAFLMFRNGMRGDPKIRVEKI